MDPKECNGQAVRDELARVLSSASFVRSERQSRFLRFLVERHLEGRDTELKESLIAVEVFGRKPDYDPKLDSTVRTEAVRLRARLSKYYAGEGNGDPMIIELPKGAYTPVFRQPEAVGEGSARFRCGLRTRVWLSIPRGCMALALAGSGWWWVQPTSEVIGIAVLACT